MIREQQPAVALLSIGLIAMGVLSVISQDFAYGWQPVPAFHPGREVLAVACGLFMIAVSVSLLFPATAAVAARAIFPFFIAWLGLKVPEVMHRPLIEGPWIGFGEIGMLLAGGWVLFARLGGLEENAFFPAMTGDRGVRVAQVLFGVATIPVGLGHIVYLPISSTLVPTWLPFRTELAFLTGAAQIACGGAVVIRFYPRIAAFVETALLFVFAFFVWGPDTWFASTPKMAGSPAGPRFPLTAFLITWVIGAAAWLIAESNSGAGLGNIAGRRVREPKADAARQ